MKKYTILFVDDEEQNGLTFTHAFFRHYHILTASSATQALEMLEHHAVQLIVSDQRMPGLSGIELLKITKVRYPQTVRMIVTGYSDVEIVMQAVNEVGIFHYALKPWSNQELKIVIDNALEKYQLTQDKEKLFMELQLLNSHLELKVEERTQELTARTEQYRKLNHVKDKLFSIISHDLRGPLGSLSIFMEMYLKYEGVFTPEETKRTIEQMQGSVTGLTQMLNNLLSWSRSQLEQQEITFTELSLQESLAAHLSLYTQMAEQKNIALVQEYSKDLPAVWSSADLLSIVLRNLLSNAIKFTPAGGQVSLYAYSKQDQVFVEVKDTGIGIQADTLEKLLTDDALYTTEGTAREKGTGLGLRLCREYCQKLGGKLAVESQVNQGTTFSFALPVAVPSGFLVNP